MHLIENTEYKNSALCQMEAAAQKLMTAYFVPEKCDVPRILYETAIIISELRRYMPEMQMPDDYWARVQAGIAEREA